MVADALDSPGQVVSLGAVAVTVVAAIIWGFKYLLTQLVPTMQAQAAAAQEAERKRSDEALREQRTNYARLMAEQQATHSRLIAEQRLACKEEHESLLELMREHRKESREEHAGLMEALRDVRGQLMDRLSTGFEQSANEIGDLRAAVQGGGARPPRPARHPPRPPDLTGGKQP